MPATLAHSAAEGIVWPAMPPPQAAMLLAWLHQIEQAQWWPEARLREHQRRQLERVLAHAHRTVPFYAARLGQAGYRPGRALSWELWAALPLLTRRDIQDAGAALVSRAPPAGHGRVYQQSTSGSTGMPVRVLKTDLAGTIGDIHLLREHLWHRHDLSGKLAIIRRDGKGRASYPDGLRSPSWTGPTGQVFATGPAVKLDVRTTVEQQVDWLRREQPSHLRAFPSGLQFIAQHCREHGITLPSLRELSTIGELVTDDARAACAEVFGLAIADLYSATEVDAMALQCPAQPVYHVQSEANLVEILDEEGRPCPPGTIGRVVVTPLHNFVMPLIRYAIDDHAEVAGACACGRGLPALRRVIGRSRNLMTLPTGAKIVPRFGTSIIARYRAIRQYQMVQKSLDEIELRLVVRHPLAPDEEARLCEWLSTAFGHPFWIAVTYHDEIPRSASGKYEDFRSEVG